jgi:hypothetical protein
LNLFALALMFLAPRAVAAAPGAAGLPTGRIAVVGAALLLAIQVPLSWFNWRSAAYLRAYVEANARAIVELARDPLHGACPSTMDLCGLPPPVRKSIMQTMQTHRSNLYSDRFRERNGFGDLEVLAAEPASGR